MKEKLIFMDYKEEGRAEERQNTLKEKKRADDAQKRAEAAEARVRELEKMLAKS